MSNEHILLKAAKNGDLECIKELIKTDVDLEIRDEEARTPLFLAAMNNYKEIVEVLLDAGADLEASPKNSSLILIWLAHHGHKDLVERFVTKGVDASFVNTDGRNARDYAKLKGFVDIVDFLDVAMIKNEWKMLSPYEVAHVYARPQIGQKITETFNFKAKERITTILDVGLQVQNICRQDFEDFRDYKGVYQAIEALESQGGDKIDRSFIKTKETAFVKKEDKRPLPIPLPIKKSGQ